MLTEADMIEAMGYYRAGDDAKLLDVFQRFEPYNWATECNEWKERHAQEFSDFLWHVISILPPESTSILDVLTLCENYTCPSGSPLIDIDLAIQTIVAFWNRKRAAEDREAIEFLSALLAHPKGEYVRETLQITAGSLATRLDIDEN